MDQWMNKWCIFPMNQSYYGYIMFSLPVSANVTDCSQDIHSFIGSTHPPTIHWFVCSFVRSSIHSFTQYGLCSKLSVNDFVNQPASWGSMGWDQWQLLLVHRLVVCFSCETFTCMGSEDLIFSSNSRNDLDLNGASPNKVSKRWK